MLEFEPSTRVSLESIFDSFNEKYIVEEIVMDKTITDIDNNEYDESIS